MPTQTKAREPNLVHYSKRTHKPYADVTAKVTSPRDGPACTTGGKGASSGWATATRCTRRST